MPRVIRPYARPTRDHDEGSLAPSARLSAAGIRGYDLDQCRFHYRQSLLYTLAPESRLGRMQLRGGDARRLADTLVLRTLTHASSLDAFATL